LCNLDAKEVLADKIYCTKNNRAALKEKNIKLIAKPLGRLPAVPIHLNLGERNPIEEKFGQAKTGYGLNCIRARLMDTSKTWIASIIQVLNLVKLTGLGSLSLVVNASESFSAMTMLLAVDLKKRFSVVAGWRSTSLAFAYAAR